MKILFAEDDRDLSIAVKTLLERTGYLVDTVHDGAEALAYAEAESYDGMILDWMMPEKDGVETLREMRSKGITTPCLLLTARDAIEDRVTGLDAGADDYLPKPFNGKELLARVRAMMRRRETYVPDVITWEDLQLDKGSCELRCGTQSVRLTGKMYQMTDSEAEINVVWVNISQLRKKLSELGSDTEIRVYRGTGYALEKQE